MDREFIQNRDYKNTDVQNIADSVFNRKQKFTNWFSNEYINRYSIDELVACVDNISSLAISKNYSKVNLWLYSNPNEFIELYNYILRKEIYRDYKNNTHKLYIIGGVVFSRFLKKIESLNKSKSVNIDSENSLASGTPSDIKMSTFKRPEEAEVINLLHKFRLKVVDKRESGGVLWVLGGRELASVMDKLDDMGFHFRFKKGGGRSSNYRDAWWYKNNFDSFDNKNLDKAANENNIVLNQPSISTVNNREVENLKEVLKENFSKGLRLDSPIELARFKYFYLDKYKMEVSFTESVLKEHILKSGILFDSKIYLLSNEVKELIKNSVDGYFNEGAQAIFYSEFYHVNEIWLFAENVVSEEMLIEIFKDMFPDYRFTQYFFGKIIASINTIVEKEILRVWGENLILTYEELSARLKYLPIERIKNTLGQNENFIWNSVESFTHISRVEITADQKQEIINAAEQECRRNGFVSISKLPIEEIGNRYIELSASALQNLAFQVCLSSKFDKKGKIVIQKGDELDALTIMKEYCRTLEMTSLEDLLKYEEELTGEIHRYIPIEAGNSIMVRTDENTFIADKYLCFDIEAIDKAIDRFIKGNYSAIKTFITFGAFPDCGKPWNQYLLESYCRRFSRSFRFDSISLNLSNSGAVVRKSCEMNYNEILVDAVVSSGIPLSINEIGKFLKDAGFISRRTTNRINQIMIKAKIVIERKG